MILFLGDQPSKKNFHDKVPFVGTVSYKRLLEWIYRLDVSITDVFMANTSDCNIRVVQDTVEVYTPEITSVADKIVVLGNKAEKFVIKSGVTDYFKLPHPSGQNYLLNDKKKLQITLDKCYNYLHDESI